MSQSADGFDMTEEYNSINTSGAKRCAKEIEAKTNYDLAQRYWYGNGVTQNYTEAAQLYKKAAEQGFAPAQYSLALCYEKGSGVSKNYAKAVKWYTKAAGQGHFSAESKAVKLLKKLGEAESALPKRNIFWRMKNSWYTMLAFLYPVSFLSFFHIGFRVDCLKWKLAGVFYMLLLLCPLLATNSTTITISIFTYFTALIHIFACRKEYLIRLDMHQSILDKTKDTALHESIKQEYGAVSKKPEQVSKPLPEQPETPAALNEFVLKIRDLNSAITDETVSRKLDNIELVLTDIFDYVKKHPEKQDAIRTLNNYYMPELIKILERYIELSEKSVRTSHMTAALTEIESVLDTVTDAFQNLYSSLFNDVTSEVSTNIKVLKDVLAQNGLTISEDEIKLSGKG